MNRTWQLGREDGPTIEFTFSAPDRIPPPAFARLRRFLDLLEQEYALDWPGHDLNKPAVDIEPVRRSPRGAVSRAAEVERVVLAAGREVTCREVCDAIGERVASITRSALMRLVGQGRLRKVGPRFAPPSNEPAKQEAPEEESAEDGDSDGEEEEEPAPPTHQPVAIPEADEEADAGDASASEDSSEEEEEEEEEKPRRSPVEASRTGPTKKRCAACRFEKPRSAFAGPAEVVCRVCTRAGKRPTPARTAASPVLVCQWPKCAAEIRTGDLVTHMQNAHGKTLQARQALAFFRVPLPTSTAKRPA